MKLRIFLLLAALVLFAGSGFVVAEEPFDEDTRRETIYFLGNPVASQDDYFFTRFFSNPAKNGILSETVPQYGGVDLIESETASYFHKADQKGNDTNTEVHEDSTTHRTEDKNSVYEFANSFQSSITEKIGVMKQNDTIVILDSREDDAEASDEFQSSDNGTYSSLVFDKKTIRNDPNRPKFISGSAYTGDFKEEDLFLHSPLSAPITLLIFMFGFCIVLIMATTVGIKLKD